MSQEANEILKGRSLINRCLYQQKIADAVEACSEQTLPTAYTGFDAKSGLARLLDGNGNIFYGNAQTNGAVGKSENIRLRRGGVLANYDEMPSRKQQQIAGITSNTIFSFAALLRAERINAGVGLTATGAGKIRAGIEPRTISILYAGSRLGGEVFTLSYDGFSLTSEPFVPGGSNSFELQYSPAENADGYIYFTLNAGSGMAVTVISNPIFYICDGRQIKKLDYQTIYVPTALTSIVKNKIYITFKENLPVSTEHFRKITIFEINRRSLQQESVQVFEYVDEDSISLPDNQDWRKSFTHSFLEHPPLDSVGCINSYRELSFAHLDVDKKIINTAGYAENLITRKRITFQNSKFIPSTDRCTTNFKTKNITLSTTPEISAKSEYCTIVGLCVY